ncbi:MAG TPA: glucosaminidase domain-containing protein [Chloroflexota bacterium]
MSRTYTWGSPPFRRPTAAFSAAIVAVIVLFLCQATAALAREAYADPSDSPTPTANGLGGSASSTPRAEPSSRGGARSDITDISTPTKFIAVVGPAARDSQRTTAVPASVTIAQAILESEWGRSTLATKGFNLFGIKAQRGPGPAGVINMNTWEVLSGASTIVNDAFRAYHDISESIEDHGRFLRDNARYSSAFKVADDPREFARRIQSAGYATDPAYASKLIRLMDKYDLYQYDLPLP